MRAARNGRVPPPCEKMKRISGQRASRPVTSRLVMVRVVSSGNSIPCGMRPGMRPTQLDAWSGGHRPAPCAGSAPRTPGRRTDRRGFSRRSCDSSPMPSALSVSSPYSISLSAPSGSGGATVAKKPKRVSWSRTVCAATSFQPRQRRRAAATSPNHGPGVDTEPTAKSMPFASIMSSACSRRPGSSRSAVMLPWA